MDSIIFDLDGTLWDSRPQVRTAWGQVIENLTGQPWTMSEADFNGLFGLPMDVIAQRLFPLEQDPMERERKAELCYAREMEYLAEHPGTLFPAVRETLSQLQTRIPLFIVSNCQQGYIELMLATTGLGDLFQGHLCYGDTLTEKGVTIRTLMARYDLYDSIYVGDTQGDADACRVAKVPFCFASYGFGQVDAYSIRIERFSELLSLPCPTHPNFS